MNKPAEDIRSILATDCGSTTTKAILIEKRGEEYQLIVRGEAPTTVEAPVEDVTAGVINAITEVEELAGRKLLDNGVILKPQRGDEGVGYLHINEQCRWRTSDDGSRRCTQPDR